MGVRDVDEESGEPRDLRVNDEPVASQHTVGHLHLVETTVGNLDRDHSWLRSESDGLKLHVLSSDESIAKALDREHETKSGEGPSRLDVDRL